MLKKLTNLFLDANLLYMLVPGVMSVGKLGRRFFLFCWIFAGLFASCLLVGSGSFAAEEKTYGRRVDFAENNFVSEKICQIFKMAESSIFPVVLSFFIVVTGIGFFLGKISWGIVIAIVIGAGIMFSSTKLLVIFVGGKGKGGCGCKPGVKTAEGKTNYCITKD